MKKVTSMLLVLVMVLSLLTACGEQTEPTEAQGKTEAPTSAQSGETAAPTEQAGKAPEDYKGTLRVWSVWAEDDGATLWIDKFHEIYPNIELEFHKFSNNGDGNLALDTALTAGEVDVLMNFGIARVDARAQAGLLYDLTDFLAADGLDSVENWGLEDNIGGKIVAIPMGGNNDHIIINKDMWDAAGLGEVPTSWTLDEYYEAARKMTKTAADGMVEVYGCSNFHSIYYAALLARGYLGDNYYFNEDGTASTDQQVWKDAFEPNYNAEMVEKIQYPLIKYRDDGIQAYAPFYEGKVAMSSMTNAMTRRIANTDEYQFDFDITYAPIPTLYKDQETNYCEGIYYFTHLSIAQDCPDPELAWQFVKWFSTDGSVYFSNTGHMPTWKSVDRSAIVSVLFGSEEEAEKLIDVEAYKRVVLNYDAPTYVEYNTTASSKLGGTLNSWIMEMMRGNISIEDGFAEMKKEMDQEIAEALAQ
ncbi:MAG: extracellular solute-binding protein [Lachnospiraceae bacterium]|nr:extracellular solute-binding protein [Lachnospiraceae bacterium]